MAGWVAPFLVVLWRPVPTIHTCDRLDWLGRRRLGSCGSTCIAHRSSCCRLCGTWTVHDCTTASQRTQAGGHAQKTREIGEHRQSLVFPGPVRRLSLLSSSSSLLRTCRTCLRSRFLDVCIPRGPKAAHRDKLWPFVCVCVCVVVVALRFLQYPLFPRPRYSPSVQGFLELISLPCREPFSFIPPPSQVNRCSRSS